MVFNYKLTIEYNGANFHGSQMQVSSKRTVQSELERVLNVFFGMEGSFLINPQAIKTTFSGRTDAGVNAIAQVVNFKSQHELALVETNADKLLLALNSVLPKDIVITKIEEVPESFNARYDAKSREYLYKIFVRRHKPVLRLDSLAWIKEPLDYEVMEAHAKTYLGTHDFSKYSKIEGKNNICTVMESELIKESSICYKYRIKANRFLRHMVRRIVGELIEIGRGADPNSAKSAPAQGLTLMKVEY